VLRLRQSDRLGFVDLILTTHRKEGVLVLSGGLTIHNLRDFASFSPATASADCKAFNQAITDALVIKEVSSPFSSRPSRLFPDDGTLADLTLSARRAEKGARGPYEA
jgi:hypothetical protein